MKRLLVLLALCLVLVAWASGQIGVMPQGPANTAHDAQPDILQGENPAQNSPEPLGQIRTNRFAVDYRFKGPDGAVPTASLILDAAGNLYGTTSLGGNTDCGGVGCGTVFKLDTQHHEKVLHAFTGLDGAIPTGRLVLDGSGDLYGTTSSGGTFGLGVVFKIDPSGTETVLHSFAGGSDGANPYSGLVMDEFGNLYGTTEAGGSPGLGTVYKVDAGGNESVVHSFLGSPSDGADPKAGLTFDSSGNLYGTTFLGGSGGSGTVFELDTRGAEAVLYSFTGGADGGNPFGGVTRDATGVLYGTAEDGGQFSINGSSRAQSDIPHGCCRGTVYALERNTFSVLYTFTGGNDGGSPAGDLVLSSGVLYGTTLAGGPGQGHQGTAFSLTIANKSETVLHAFSGKADGGMPQAGLVMNSAGVLYGTAERGGGLGKHGTVFQYKTR